jgi:glycosyltransferase involved in cell wall biosynthesis
MRIAMLTSSYPRFYGDGTAPFIQSIAEALSLEGHNVAVVAPYDPLVQTTNPREITIYRFHYAPSSQLHIMGHARALENDSHLRTISYFLAPLYLASAAYHLYKVARSQKSDIIYAHWVIPNGPPAALVAGRLKIPLLISLHGSDIFTALRNKAIGEAARWAFSKSKAVTACSPELKEGALKLGAPSNTRLLAWGADPQKFNPNKRSDEYRNYLGLKKNHFAIGGLGRLVQKKGFNLLLDAFARIHSKCPETVLLIGGEGPLSFNLKEQAEELGINESVKFLGRIPWDQVPTFLASLDLFVLPSIQNKAGNMDGLPTVLLEAMGAGTPVIASDIGGALLAIEDQFTGLIFPSGNVNALTNCLMELINKPNLRAQIAAQARLKIETELNWRMVASTITSLL